MSSQMKKINNPKKYHQKAFSKNKPNSTIQNYIEQKLKLVEFKQHMKNQVSVNSSNQSVLSKSSKSLIKPQTPNSTFIHMRHKKAESLPATYTNWSPKISNSNDIETFKGQLSSMNKKTEIKPQSELDFLRKENKKLKNEITKCKQKIHSLEKAIETALAENDPIDITKCPKPMPYINNHYHFNYYTHNHIDKFMDIDDLSFNHSIH